MRNSRAQVEGVMELARFAGLLALFCHYGSFLAGGISMIELWQRHYGNAARAMKWAMLLGGCWQILTAMLLPFADAHGVYKQPLGWNQSPAFYWAMGIAMFVVSLIMHLVHLRIKNSQAGQPR